MSRLLYIESSPRKNDSSSIAISKEFIETLSKEDSDIEIDVLDLWDEDLPSFNGSVIDAKYAYLHGQNPSGPGIDAWHKIEKIVERFKTADHYLFSIPMWNFGIPYVLKHYIDILVQPGLTFQFSPESGYTGIVKANSATVIYARGGVYSTPEMQGLDFQKKYMDLLLGFIGITDVNTIICEPTLGEPDSVEEAKQKAVKQAREIVTTFYNKVK
ncbi:FMN-dependent NADH-azoreductase [Aquimarina aquimarini]|uniref:FMN-dependent NADH-azoreductase n=1 Tax=Aquimarina aquimarini TaxID=1191734 RepID=UPI000D552DD4|nr:NAD(P)H-dependent oxidoreductase [Aquimarina aquimarini]